MKQKILAEIERLKKYSNTMGSNAINSNMRNFYDGSVDALKQVEDFINSLPQEPVSEDLEKELRAYVNSKEYTNTIGTSGLLLIARHFANWQKKRTIKKACDWWEKNDSYAVPTNVQIERFKQAMKQ